MSHLSFSKLSLKVDELLERHIKLASEVRMLKKELSTLQAEKELLLAQNQLAAQKIKHVVSQLREEIHERIA